MSRPFRSAALALFLLTGTVQAGPVAEFEAEFRPLYASYRAALFHTNSGKTDLATEALTKLADGWAALGAEYGATPPPQYADDPEWGATLEAVAAKVARAKELVAEGELAEAHEVLEGVREDVGALHARNGIETYSDRMNAYHAAMEEVLGADLAAPDAEAVAGLREHAAVLAYLAADVLAKPPAEAAGEAKYGELSAAFQASVEAFQAAARSGDAEAIRSAAGGLKPAYSRLFLQFG
jgi:hypothetical protein